MSPSQNVSEEPVPERICPCKAGDRMCPLHSNISYFYLFGNFLLPSLNPNPLRLKGFSARYGHTFKGVEMRGLVWYSRSVSRFEKRDSLKKVDNRKRITFKMNSG